ncbi:response regulator receiver modulated diguanylate cyclase [Primorskyibacter sedentarius]|uniref:diguanylate cyclase n=1 Tax=Primorskyibacter sedentarius TaxID=745311 RepID=A0A4R3J8E3_9RHOB|nr:diguanylate cyclase [Primorskyibacter sedentarius]TCS60800.1 response regulator receiver modulated diguanylate cyclase [Primorskyibacter sedentarius]
MPQTVLIVDEVATNRIVLRVKLAAAYYSVKHATTGAEALAVCAKSPPDVILLGQVGTMKAGDLARRLRSNPKTETIPLIFLTPPENLRARVEALEAGADDVLSHPVSEMMLLARIRNLSRARDAERELRLREGTRRALGFAEASAGFEMPARVTVVTDHPSDAGHWLDQLRQRVSHRFEIRSPREMLAQNPDASKAPDVCIVMLPRLIPETGLGTLSELRARSATRHCAMLVLCDRETRQAAASALDLGGNDLLAGAFDPDELALRLQNQIARKRTADRLRATMRDGLHAAVTDPLTGLYNRRYALPHLARVSQEAQCTGRRFAVLIADLDHFKQINDVYGHAAGDAVLAGVARQIKENLRAVDLVARIGGEEFLMVLPDTDSHRARRTAQRLCQVVRNAHFLAPGQDVPLRATVSIGMAMGPRCSASTNNEGDDLLTLADRALYASKSEGRNKVTLSRDAA